MTLPVPLATDPAADAALHIRNFAEAVEARLASTIVVRTFDTGERQANAAGVITGGTMTEMATITGAISGPVSLLDNASHSGSGDSRTDLLFRPLVVRNPGAGNVLSFRCFNPPTNAVNANRFARIVGLCWGPAAGTVVADPPDWARPTDPDAAARLALDAAAVDAARVAKLLGAGPGRPAPLLPPAGLAPRALPPGSSFPAGRTAHGIRFPGTTDPLWRTATAITELAGDIGNALGGAPLGLTLATWRGTLTVSGPNWSVAGNSIERVMPELSRIRGAVATAWDASGGFRQSRNFGWIDVRDWQPVQQNICRLFIDTNAPSRDDGFNIYPGTPPAGSAAGVSILAWGDPA